MDSVPAQLKYHRPERERGGMDSVPAQLKYIDQREREREGERERSKCETERYGQCTCTAKVPPTSINNVLGSSGAYSHSSYLQACDNGREVLCILNLLKHPCLWAPVHDQSLERF